MTGLSTCILVPHYNHHSQFERTLPRLVATGLSILVIDDGSSVESQTALRAICADQPSVSVYFSQENQGKGGAIIRAFEHARQLGFTHGLQIDADGQHDAGDITRFLAESEACPDAIISGCPQFSDDISATRYYGRKLTIWLVVLETLSIRIVDPMCGYRIYPLDLMHRILARHKIGRRMDFDIELLVKCYWENVAIRFIKTNVIYPQHGLSHFNYLRDNTIIGAMHARLLSGMVKRLPSLVGRHFQSH